MNTLLPMPDPKTLSRSWGFPGSRRDKVSMARALIAFLAVREMRYRGSEVGRILGVSEPGIAKCVDRGKKMLNDDSELRSKLITRGFPYRFETIQIEF